MNSISTDVVTRWDVHLLHSLQYAYATHSRHGLVQTVNAGWRFLLSLSACV